MIVIGTDTHKQTHTCAAVNAATGQLAGELTAETAGAGRLSSDSKFARLAGVAPIPASSGMRTRHRLDRGGNRQLNCALHRIAVTQGRCHAPARRFLAKKRERSMNNVDTQRDSLAPQIAAVA